MHITCAWDFLFMRTRLLIHYLDGSTFKGTWNKDYDFMELETKVIRSLQLQEEDGKLYTLSSKIKTKGTFWYTSYYNEEDNLRYRSIFRKLKENIWLQLKLDTNTGEKEILIIKENINA